MTRCGNSGWVATSRIFAGNPVRPKRGEQVELGHAGIFSPTIGQIDNLTLRRSIDRTVGFVDKAAQVLGMPVIATGLPLLAIHALLHPSITVIGDEDNRADVAQIRPGRRRCQLWHRLARVNA